MMPRYAQCILSTPGHHVKRGIMYPNPHARTSGCVAIMESAAHPKIYAPFCKLVVKKAHMAGILKDQVTITVSGWAKAESEPREIPGAPWLKWSLHAYPRGKANTSNFIEVFVRVVGGGVHVNALLEGQSYGYSQVKKTFEHEFNDGEEHGCKDFCDTAYSTDEYPFQITCTATFKPKETKLTPLMVHELIDKSKPHFSDAKIVIGTEEIKVYYLNFAFYIYATVSDPPRFPFDALARLYRDV
uniref:MATH domain-containing protein n=1 Tax=Panagrellus redivivus TaxID=6233 RepID=A0A7E4WCF3_PANRE